ncbi:hypothetical protein LQK89_17920 (plasmid) [Curtobacterium sp. C1]|uniref:hypothetical protein n=1 Tax=Curtobacterium sp. C1 TaxID=2898151 RepID=UPI001E42B8ED|nr:hypothetical protein [Curtobacterium sp. C1]UFU16101.1 hypothetical protein LQK89_17920 [Curtobacterium sp. C1]
MRWIQKLEHWLGMPTPRELGNPSSVPAGTIHIDAAGRPFEAVVRRGRPTYWARRWYETLEQADRRQKIGQWVYTYGAMYHGVLIGVFAVGAIQGWTYNGPALLPLLLILPTIATALAPRLWDAVTITPLTADPLEEGLA